MAAQAGIDERTLEFSADVIEFVRTIRLEPASRTLCEQLSDSAGSVAANRQEATSASSRREFIRYNEIALRSAKESLAWLRTCHKTRMGDASRCADLLNEVQQIVRILAAIVVNTKRRDQSNL